MQKESVFVNSYIFTEEIMREYTNRATGRPRKYRAAIGIAGVLLGVLVISNPYFKAFCIAAGLFLLCFCIPSRACIAEKEYKVYMLTHSCMQKTLTFYVDRIESVNGSDGALIYRYSQITKAYETENLCVMSMENQVSVIVKKDAFIKGTFEDFKEFMNIKEIPIKK